MRGWQVLFDELFERALAVPQRVGHVRVHLAGAVSGIELRHLIERLRESRNSSVAAAPANCSLFHCVATKISAIGSIRFTSMRPIMSCNFRFDF